MELCKNLEHLFWFATIAMEEGSKTRSRAFLPLHNTTTHHAIFLLMKEPSTTNYTSCRTNTLSSCHVCAVCNFWTHWFTARHGPCFFIVPFQTISSRLTKRRYISRPAHFFSTTFSHLLQATRQNDGSKAPLASSSHATLPLALRRNSTTLLSGICDSQDYIYSTTVWSIRLFNNVNAK